MDTNYEVIKKFDSRELAEFISNLDVFCNMCAYKLSICKNNCVDGHQAWLEQKYVKEEKE